MEYNYFCQIINQVMDKVKKLKLMTVIENDRPELMAVLRDDWLWKGRGAKFKVAEHDNAKFMLQFY